MAKPALAYKQAEEATLRARPDLAIAMGLAQVRLYVEVPQNAPLPYVVYGQHEVDTDDFGDCGQAHQVVSTVQWWTGDVGEIKGSDVVRLMGSEIFAALMGEMTIAGYATVLVEQEVPETYGTDPDGSSRGRVVVRREITPLD